MMTVEEFFTSYPDFKSGNSANAHIAMVQTKLDECATEIDPLVFGVKTDVYHGLLTAQRLALSPFGRNAKMVSKNGETSYDAQIKKLQRQVWGKARPLL